MLIKKIFPSWLRQLRNVRFREGRWRLGVSDRQILEGKILPYFSGQQDIRRVLDVGCAWFTKWYHELFPNAEYWTIERYAELAKHGAPNHKSISLLDASEHFAEASFDLVLCNGVFGWGIDDRQETELALAAVAALLRDGGSFVIGWDDNDDNRPNELPRLLAEHFEAASFPPRGEHAIRTATRWQHVFSFYQRRCRV